MIDYKQIIPCIYLINGEAVDTYEANRTVIEDPVGLALSYDNYGADAIFVFDFSCEDEAHTKNITIIRNICRTVDIPVVGVAKYNSLDRIKQMIYAGCAKACIYYDPESSGRLIEDAGRRFGREHISVCVDRSEQLDNIKNEVKNYSSSILIKNEDELEKCAEWVLLNCTHNIHPIVMGLVPLYNRKTFHDAAADLRKFEITGVAGGDFNKLYKEFMSFKRQCKSLGIAVNTFDSKYRWEDFKLNSDGMLPVIVQDYKTDDVLMMAYMNEEAYQKTVETGIMTYWSRSRDELWVKGDTSGHYQFVKSLTADCDLDTILARVYQVGAACHTGSRSCFFNDMMKKRPDETNPMRVLQEVYKRILERKENHVDDSYTNYIFDRGLDKILKKFGEECTEVIIESKNPDPEELRYSISDLAYQVMLLMAEKGLSLEDVSKELSHR